MADVVVGPTISVPPIGPLVEAERHKRCCCTFNYYTYLSRLARPPLTTPAQVGLVPLLGVKVEADVIDMVAQIKLEQKYKNTEQVPLEVEFSFPLESTFVLHRFEAEVDGRHLKGIVKDKEEAFDTYSDAIASGNTAFLAEKTKQNEEAVFKTSIGNLPPGRECTVCLWYLTELKIEGEETLLVIPTRVMPPLSPIHAGTEGIQIQVSVRTPTAIRSINSPSHTIQMEFEDDRANISLKSDTHYALEKDFVIAIKQRDNSAPRGWAELTPMGELSAAMVAFHPTFQDHSVPREIIFLVDRSGSMRRERKIQQAINALQLFLRGLPEDSLFNIVSFGTRFSLLWPKSKPYNDDTLEEATQHVQSMSANMLETNIYEPLKEIFHKERPNNHLREVFVLTDGAVSNPQRVIELVKANCRKHTRVFALGLGAGASAYLVREMARVGRGTAEFAHKGDRLETKVMKQLKLATSEALSEVAIEWRVNGKPVKPMAVEHLAPVFSGQTIVAYALFDPPMATGATSGNAPKISAGLTGLLGEKKQEVKFDVDIDARRCLGASTPGSTPSAPVAEAATGFVTKLAAGSVIRGLEMIISTASADRALLPTKEQMKPQILPLALKYGLISRFTSFVAIDTESSEAVGATMITRTIDTTRTINTPRTYPPPPPSVAGPLVKMSGSNASSHPRRVAPDVASCELSARQDVGT